MRSTIKASNACRFECRISKKFSRGWFPILAILIYYENTKQKDVKNSNGSSHQRCSMLKGVLRNFTKFTGKRLCLSLFFNKVSGLEAPTQVFRPATLLKKRLLHRCFPVNFVKFLRTAFLQNNSGRLRLTISFLAKFIIATHQLLNPLIWCCSSKLYVWKFRLWCKYFSDISAATD